MNYTLNKLNYKGHRVNLLTMPNTNFFKFEIINKFGSNVERVYNKKTGKNVFGISHFIEHLAFKSTKDFDTNTLMKHLKNDGVFNASTDYHRINYWFKTTMNKYETGMKLMFNCAYNDLKNIKPEEFETEKKVVMNEAKRYADDDQTMFYFNTGTAQLGLHEEDNVIGIPDTIEKFSLEDAIDLKSIFLNEGETIFNICYDPTVLTENEIMDTFDRYYNIHVETLKLTPSVTISQEDYFNGVGEKIVKSKSIVSNEAEQNMTFANICKIDNIFVARLANLYLCDMAEDTSLTDLIREQNGLTYGVHFDVERIGKYYYTCFACDVSKGTENLLMELFKQSINESVDNFSIKKYEEFIESLKLKRDLGYLNVEKFTNIFYDEIWHENIVEKYDELKKHNIRDFFDLIYSDIATFENLKNYMQEVRQNVNNNSYSLVTNY